MKEQRKGRIAILQAEWPVQSQTANAIVMLAEAGYDVDLFLFNTWTYIDLDNLRETTRAHIYDLRAATRPDTSNNDNRSNGIRHALTQRATTFLRATAPPVVSLYRYVRSARDITVQEARECYLLLTRSEKGLLPEGIRQQALELMRGKNYRCLIGVEKKGLIWAGQIAETLRVPFIYYNLELYNEDYQRPPIGTLIDFKRLRLIECRYHRKAWATIVQDPERARVLFRGNGLSMAKANIYYIPVSIMGGAYRKRSSFLQDSLGLPKDRKVILYFGQIWEKRYVLELTKVAQSFPEDWILVMHGEDYDSAVEKIRTLDRRKRVIISLKMVPSDRIREVVASADIGLAFYSHLTRNERLTAFASEKLALYMQCGVPFIAFDYPGYQHLASDDQCGVVIRGLQELPKAIQNILISHEEFRRCAYQAFYKHYDFAHNFAQVIEGVACLQGFENVAIT